MQIESTLVILEATVLHVRCRGSKNGVHDGRAAGGQREYVLPQWIHRLLCEDE
jgi:hypothetical protein